MLCRYEFTGGFQEAMMSAANAGKEAQDGAHRRCRCL